MGHSPGGLKERKRFGGSGWNYGKARKGVVVVIIFIILCSTIDVTLEEPLVSMSVVKVKHDVPGMLDRVVYALRA